MTHGLQHPPSLPIPAPDDPEVVSAANSQQVTVRLRANEVFISSPDWPEEFPLLEYNKFINGQSKAYRPTWTKYQHAESAYAKAKARCAGWTNGAVLRRILKRQFQRVQDHERAAQSAMDAAQEALAAVTCDLRFNLSAELLQHYRLFVEAFDSAAACSRVWRTQSSVATGQEAYLQRNVGTTVTRKPARLNRQDRRDLWPWRLEEPAPEFVFDNGMSLYIFPVFAVLVDRRMTMEMVQLADVFFQSRSLDFVEDEKLPSDAPKSGSTWQKANADGSRDRRFKDNRQIPLVRYGKISVILPERMSAEFMISKPDPADRLRAAWEGITTFTNRRNLGFSDAQWRSSPASLTPEKTISEVQRMWWSSMGLTNIPRDLIKRAVIAGLPTDLVDGNNRTPLMLASMTDDLELAKLILSKGAAIDATDRFGISALYLATINLHQRMVDFLLLQGADPSQQAAAQKTLSASSNSRVGT